MNDWQRLDPLMLLVHPVREITRFLPALIVVTLAGGATEGRFWQLFAVVIPVVIGLVRYLTTTYRVTAGRVELRRGVISRHLLSTPVDRVRTVDLTSSLIQRALGLTSLRVGTGTASTSDDEKLELDGLPLARARALREELLRAGHADDQVPPPTDSMGFPSYVAHETVVEFSPAWLKYAPLTGSGIVIAAAVVGFAAQFLELAGFWDNLDADDYGTVGVGSTPVGLVVALVILFGIPAISLLAVVGYLINNWAFAVTRRPPGPGGDWHVTRGLFTTRETTLDDDRVAGVELSEPLGIRAIGGAQLDAIVTGLDRSARANSTLVPPAPLADVRRAASVVLADSDGLAADLVPHGPRATRRRWVRAMVPALLVAAGAIAVVARGGSPWWLLNVSIVPLAAALAGDRARSLGHLLTDRHLIAREGSVVRRRRVLHTDHVIGWNLRATWFQRRAGLTTLVATTAGGSQAVPVPDVPEDVAIDLADRALPGLLSQFTN